ncbi:hypothetical protein AOLI_G00169400 [Acnodon oligacanthus]
MLRADALALALADPARPPLTQGVCRPPPALTPDTKLGEEARGDCARAPYQPWARASAARDTGYSNGRGLEATRAADGERRRRESDGGARAGEDARGPRLHYAAPQRDGVPGLLNALLPAAHTLPQRTPQRLLELNEGMQGDLVKNAHPLRFCPPAHLYPALPP